MPKACYFILPNEFGERFCYYGVQPNLNKYFQLITGMNKTDAKVYSTAFTMLAYFFPLIGAALSDSFLGKWWTIISFSGVYMIGMIMVTVFAIPNLIGPIGQVSKFLTFLPMIIIAIGTGGIKPCVSSHGGDQYLPSQEAAKDFFFNIFYVSINVGALLTQFIVPEISKIHCYGQETCFAGAFLLPTLVFACAYAIFAAGHRYYRIVPPLGEFLPLKATKAAVFAANGYFAASAEERAAKGHWLNFAEEKYGGVFVEEVRDFGLVLVPVVIPMSFCWMLYNQNSNEWSNQYYLMNGALFGGNNPAQSYIQSAQFSNINTILLIIFVPILATFVYPFCSRRGWNFGPQRRMAAGFFLVIVSFALSAALAPMIEDAFQKSGRDMAEPAKYDGTYCKECYSGWLQFPQWVLLSLGEALFSPTGVQFTYIEAGRQFRAVSTAFWLLATSFGSILIMVLEPAFASAEMSSSTKGWAYSGIGLFGLILYCIASYFYTPRKQRPSINEAARAAKEAEYAITKY
ncbi:POT family-domain-containing protein [Lobosporangium transversale]|uniref:POT family-domain-containing protein n=1 Tax=Lobosporangium transversale TaxID=64571 RepID=A0A1Y2GDC9_9FUNG|nr:POT family-domain-containing protein [Lobosporangium transversale]ORZ07732.1 POT family-domain-containing protein [Lobosporangium transversale]|eukprot:XP_021878098.1 POT family-domain-containing protein [Lobosporangium transversale]